MYANIASLIHNKQLCDDHISPQVPPEEELVRLIRTLPALQENFRCQKAFVNLCFDVYTSRLRVILSQIFKNIVTTGEDLIGIELALAFMTRRLYRLIRERDIEITRRYVLILLDPATFGSTAAQKWYLQFVTDFPAYAKDSELIRSQS